MCSKTEAGHKGGKGNEEKETKLLLSSDKSEKAHAMFCYFLTDPIKEEKIIECASCQKCVLRNP